MDFVKIGKFVLFAYVPAMLVGIFFYVSKTSFTSVLGICILAFLLMPAPLVAALLVEKKFLKHRLHFPKAGKITEILQFILLPGIAVLSALILILVVTLLFGNTWHWPHFGTLAVTIDDLRANIVSIYGRALADSANYPPSIPIFIVVTAIASFIIGWSINGLFAFGEEYGWRGFLWEALAGLGYFRKNLVIGVVWGLWHAPIIVLGYNYPDNPFAGVLMMCLFTTSLSFLLSAIRSRTNSVLPVAATHGGINGIATMVALVTLNNNVFINGFLGIVGCAIIAALGIILEFLIPGRPAKT